MWFLEYLGGAGAGVEGVWVGVQREVLEGCRGSVRGSEGERERGD